MAARRHRPRMLRTTAVCFVVHLPCELLGLTARLTLATALLHPLLSPASLPSAPPALPQRRADLNLLKHDKPLAATGAAAAAAHLKHLPAYLRDPTLQGRSFVGNSGEPACSEPLALPGFAVPQFASLFVAEAASPWPRALTTARSCAGSGGKGCGQMGDAPCMSALLPREVPAYRRSALSTSPAARPARHQPLAPSAVLAAPCRFNRRTRRVASAQAAQDRGPGPCQGFCAGATQGRRRRVSATMLRCLAALRPRHAWLACLLSAKRGWAVCCGAKHALGCRSSRRLLRATLRCCLLPAACRVPAGVPGWLPMGAAGPSSLQW